MNQSPTPICFNCKHFRGAKQGTCDAFPSEIPDQIWSGKIQHDAPFPGDRGVRFVPVDMTAFLSVAELAKLLNVDPKTVYRALWSKRIPAYKVGSMWRVAKRDVEFFKK